MTGLLAGSLSRPDPVLARQAFRAVLDALARPGRATGLPQLDGVPPVLVPLLTLADLDTPICLLEDAGSDADLHAPSCVPEKAGAADLAVPSRLPREAGRRRDAGLADADGLAMPAAAGGSAVPEISAGGLWSAQAAAATSAPVVALPDARLVAALRPVTLGELGAMRPGVPLAPEQAALAALAVPCLESGPRLALSGPGTGPGTTLAVAGLPDRWWSARGRFPLGVDLLLITPDGRCVGVPRSSVLTTEKEG